MLTTRKMTAVLLAGSMLSGAAFAGNPAGPSYTPDLLPPNPETGECYARVEIPAQYRTEGETVMLEEGYRILEASEAQLRSRQEQILVKEASVRYQVRQPTYRTVTDNVMVRPAYEKLQVTPPQFSTVRETVTVSNPRLVWKRGNPAKLKAQGYKIHSTADGGRGGQGYRSTVAYGRAQVQPELCGKACEVWCLVEAPGETVTYNRKVVSSPARVQRVPVPAKYTSITKQVVADPGGVQEIPVPAEYRSVTIQELTGGGDVRETERPPVYGDIAKKVMIQDGRYEWRRVVCKPGTHPADRRSTGVTGSGYSASGYSSGGSSSSGYSSGYQYGSGHSTQGYQGRQSRTYGGAASQGHSGGARLNSSTGGTYSSGAHSSGYTASGRQTYGGSHTGTSYAPMPVTRGQGSTGHTTSGQATTESQTHYYGSGLPTYSEDYRLPAPTRTAPQYGHEVYQPAREKRRYR